MFIKQPNAIQCPMSCATQPQEHHRYLHHCAMPWRMKCLYAAPCTTDSQRQLMIFMQAAMLLSRTLPQAQASQHEADDAQ